MRLGKTIERVERTKHLIGTISKQNGEDSFTGQSELVDKDGKGSLGINTKLVDSVIAKVRCLL